MLVSVAELGNFFIFTWSHYCWFCGISSSHLLLFVLFVENMFSCIILFMYISFICNIFSYLSWNYGNTFLHEIGNNCFFLCQETYVYTIIASIWFENWFKTCSKISVTFVNISIYGKNNFSFNFVSYWWNVTKFWEDEIN